MGEVYRAQDEVLKRTVALKLLPAVVAADPSLRARFRAEAQTASALNHPGITTVYEIGEDQGQAFIVMEYVEGESLRALLAAGPLDLHRAVDLAASVAETLAAAHERGVVHRDIKPDNIMVTPDGRTKILDFGLAKLREPVEVDEAAVTADLGPTTQAGVIMGTLGYMPPEQMSGQAVDFRGDIYSFGLVLYEMVTGRRALLGLDARAHLPPGLSTIIEKATRQDPAERYQSTRDLVVDLRHALAPPRGAGAPKKGRRAAAVVALMLAAVALGAWWYRTRAPRPARTVRRAVAVLYFRNLTQDPTLDWLNGGLTEMLTTNLSQVPGMDVLSTERIMAAFQRLGRKEGVLDPSVALEVAHSVGADIFITGALMKLVTRLRIDVRMQDSGGQILFSERLEGDDVRSVFSMVDTVTAGIAQRLVPGARPPSIEEAATTNLEAYRHYQAARDYDRRFLLDEATREFEEAARQDPQFALAYLSLFDLYHTQANLLRREETWRKLERLQPRLPRKERLIFQGRAALRAGDIEAQVRALESVLREFPRESGSRNNLAYWLQKLNQVDRAVTVLHEGLTLDPRDELLWNQLSYLEAWAGNLPGALEANDRYRALLPGDPNPWDTRGDVLYQFAHDGEALAAYRRELEIKPDFNGFQPYLKLAIVYADQRRFGEAEASFREYREGTTALGKAHLPLNPDLLT